MEQRKHWGGWEVWGQLAQSLHRFFLRTANVRCNIAKIHAAGNAICPVDELDNWPSRGEVQVHRQGVRIRHRQPFICM